MTRAASEKSALELLYPATVPYAQKMLDVGQGHQVYVEECGNPDGIPIVVLHGGPGGGCSPAMRRYFDPKAFRIVLFDQRGCGKSRPHAEVANNTTWDLVADIELIRQTLGIEKWAVFGGSWGATLALIYAQAHPDRVSELILRGVFLMTERELDWFYGGGAGQFWPDTWAEFCAPIPAEDQGDLIAAYHSKLFSGDRNTEIQFARSWARWENALASIQSSGKSGDAPAEYARAFARLENHYFINRGFLTADQQILANTDKLANIPGVIVQGRYDMICPPKSAWALHQA